MPQMAGIRVASDREVGLEIRETAEFFHTRQVGYEGMEVFPDAKQRAVVEDPAVATASQSPLFTVMLPPVRLMDMVPAADAVVAEDAAKVPGVLDPLSR